MIKIREVAKMKIPFPNISSQLAIQEHMYICCKDGSHKEFVKCQTYKPLHHTRSDIAPFKFIVERSNPTRNPFDKPETLIDLDKLFLIGGVKFDRRCLTTNRCNICKGLYNQVLEGIESNQNLMRENLDFAQLRELNNFLA